MTLQDLIIENSFNRYINRLEAQDKLIPQYAETPRRPVNYQSTDVQQEKYYRPAAALAIAGMADRVTVERCRLIGVENTLYGDAGCRLYMHNCHIMGAKNIITGGMTLLCSQSSLDIFPIYDKDAYLTAARTQVGLRGFFFYRCFIRSAEPLQEMVSDKYAQGCSIVKPKDHYGEILFDGTEFDLALEDMAYDPSLFIAIKDPEYADGFFTPYAFTRGTDGWNPTNDPEGEYDRIVDLKLGIHVGEGELVMHHIPEPTTMRVITSDGSSFIDQLLTGTQAFKMQPGVYWLIFENNKGKQSKKIEVK